MGFRKPDNQQKPAKTEKVQCQFTGGFRIRLVVVHWQHSHGYMQSLGSLLINQSSRPVLFYVTGPPFIPILI